MTLDDKLDWDGAIYGSVSESSTELMLQPYASRYKVMKTAWLGLLGFLLMALPFTILPTFLVTLFGLISLSAVAPGLQNHPFTLGAILLLWGSAFLTIAFLSWQAIEDSGYKTFTFDRTQKQLFINISTIIGRKVVKTIPFSQIRDARLDEREHERISMSVLLVLDDREILGMTHPNNIVLSSFGSVTTARTVEILTAKKHHQELLLAVRDVLSFSTQEISEQLRQSPAIPTAEELERQQAKATADAQASLMKIAKLTFASKETKLEEIESLRSKTLTHSDDPQVWEQFALALSLQKNSPKDEIISAYHRAETIYLDRGNVESAAAVTRILKGLTKGYSKR
jgi:hypothetical protein